MRTLAALIGMILAACRSASSPVPQPSASAASCALLQSDSAWLATAIDGWRRTAAPLLATSGSAIPPLILFDTRCAFTVDARSTWTVSGTPHRGTIVLPNGRSIGPISIGITSPTRGDTALFLALALPEVWRTDPRYRDVNESRAGWERYLVGAFSHEMTHAHMLPALLPRLRELEAAIFPDTIEDNAVQNRFGADREFAASVMRETELLYRAATTSVRRTRVQYARAAIAMMRERRARYYVGDLEPWSDLEQVFLDLEGVAQWVAFQVRWGPFTSTQSYERALARFRSGREFWSEDQGLALVLALDALSPGWPRQLLGTGRVSTLDLLSRAVEQGRF